LKKPLLFLSCLCVQGSPLWWAATHRGKHHPHADKDGDPHSPKDGFFHSYIGWLHNRKLGKINTRFIPDIRKDKFHLWLNRRYTYIVLATFIVLGLINIEFMLWFWLIPAVLSFHQEAIVNSVCHLGKFGYRTFDTKDKSMNIPLLALLTWGQALHNNHHYDYDSYNFAKKKNEFDPCTLFLPFIEEKVR